MPLRSKLSVASLIHTVLLPVLASRRQNMVDNTHVLALFLPVCSEDKYMGGEGNTDGE